MLKQPDKSIILGVHGLFLSKPTMICLQIRVFPLGNTNFLTFFFSIHVHVILRLVIYLHNIYSFPVSVINMYDVLFRNCFATRIVLFDYQK